LLKKTNGKEMVKNKLCFIMYGLRKFGSV